MSDRAADFVGRLHMFSNDSFPLTHDAVRLPRIFAFKHLGHRRSKANGVNAHDLHTAIRIQCTLSLVMPDDRKVALLDRKLRRVGA